MEKEKYNDIIDDLEGIPDVQKPVGMYYFTAFYDHTYYQASNIPPDFIVWVEKNQSDGFGTDRFLAYNPEKVEDFDALLETLRGYLQEQQENANTAVITKPSVESDPASYTTPALTTTQPTPEVSPAP